MSLSQKISTFLWFDTQAEEAARFYVGLFPNSRIVSISHYSEVGQEFHQRAVGSVMTVEFELEGQPFTALNGGPAFRFTEAISLQVLCDTQEEIDHYWAGLGEGGDPEAQQCGWLKDRYGLSWQITPRRLMEFIVNPSTRDAAMAAMLEMRKLDLSAIERAVGG